MRPIGNDRRPSPRTAKRRIKGARRLGVLLAGKAAAVRNEDAKAAQARRVPADVGFQPNQRLRQEASKRKDRYPKNDPAKK